MFSKSHTLAKLFFAMAIASGVTSGTPANCDASPPAFDTTEKTKRPDLNGVRVKTAASPDIYLIVDGELRHIPSPEIYDRLFKSWDGIVVDNNIDRIVMGKPLTDAVLIKGSNSPDVFLLDRGVKRHISSPATMSHYNFAWNRVHTSPQAEVDAIEKTGKQIVMPTKLK
ncbi:hypothetical protein OAG68_02925 [bacterium]|nr:hypothetical protein [bacterium]